MAAAVELSAGHRLMGVAQACQQHCGGPAAWLFSAPPSAPRAGLRMGRSQAVRQRILIPPSPGSNPGAPATVSGVGSVLDGEMRRSWPGRHGTMLERRDDGSRDERRHVIRHPHQSTGPRWPPAFDDARSRVHRRRRQHDRREGPQQRRTAFCSARTARRLRVKLQRYQRSRQFPGQVACVGPIRVWVELFHGPRRDRAVGVVWERCDCRI
jgi:hypothetical protein